MTTANPPGPPPRQPGQDMTASVTAGPGEWTPTMSALRVFTSPGRVEDGWLALAAADLQAAERSRIPAATVTQRCPDLTLAQAYRIQWTNVEARIIGGARIAGHKVGLTSLAMQQQMGVDEPDSGVLLDDMIVPSGSELNLRDLVVPRVETEIGVRLGRPLRGPDVDADEARDAVCEVFLALEVIDTRYGAWQIALEDSVADNASAARAVVGAAVPLRPSLDLCAEELTLNVNGETAATGEGRAVLGNPLNAVAWLARRLGDYGAGLHAGDLVLPGSVHASLPLEAGSEIRASSPHLPPVSLRIA